MIKQITINNWKNIQEKCVDFKKGINIIVGPNGAGKTSIIEAIYFSLNGETKDRESIKNLRTVGSKESLNLELILKINNVICKVIRNYDKIFRSSIYEEDTLIFKKKRDVDRYIPECFNINKVLFSNLFYSSEGEIYKFQNIKSRTDFVSYLEGILGLDKLNDFYEISNLLNTFMKKEERSIKIKMRQLEEIQTKSGLPEKNLRAKLEDFIQSKNDLLELKDKTIKELTKVISERNYINNLIEGNQRQFHQIFDSVKDIIGKEITNKEDLSYIKNLLNEKIDNLQLKIKKDKGVYKKKMSLINKNAIRIEETIDKLNYYHKMDESNQMGIVCPVCESKLNRSYYSNLKINTNNLYSNLIKTKSELETEFSELDSKLDRDREKVEKFKRIMRQIEHFKTTKEDSNTEKLIKQRSDLNINFEKNQEKLSSLENQERDLDRNIIELEKELTIVDYTYKFQQIGNYSNNLEAIKIGNFYGDLIINALNEMSKGYKENMLQPVIQEMMNIWINIFPNETREISIDENFAPTLKYKSGIITYDHLSAGEKTLLLVILKTLMIKYFSSLSFLILDEPIEHLDEENRNIIIDYLYKITKDDLIDQLIISTYEESIVRKFLNLSDANVIYLEQK